jgi:hypothetical protein
MVEESPSIDPTTDVAHMPRQRRRANPGAMLPGLALVAVGAWALLTYSDQPDRTIAWWEVAGLLAAGWGVSMLTRALAHRRTEAGLLFAGSLVTLTAVTAIGAWLLFPDEATLSALWPLGLGVLGISLVVTQVMGRVRGLMLPELGGIMAGVLALPFARGDVPAGTLDIIKDIGPIALALVGLIVIVAALGRPREEAPEDGEEPDTANRE